MPHSVSVVLYVDCALVVREIFFRSYNKVKFLKYQDQFAGGVT